jgi:tetratricopeptide (TPR) repeat protein
MESKRERELRERREELLRAAKAHLPVAERAYLADPTNPDLALAYAHAILMSGGDASEEIRVLEEAERHWPDHPKIAERLGNAYVRADRSEAEVRAVYERAIELSPGDSTAILSYASAIAYAFIRQDEARALYERAVQLFPNCSYSWFRLGNSLSFGDRASNALDDRARDCYARALECGDLPEVLLGGIATSIGDARGDLTKARALFDKLLALAPDDATVLDRYAEFASRAIRDYPLADRLYTKARELGFASGAQAHDHYIILVAKLGEWERAEALHREVRDEVPNDSGWMLLRAKAIAFLLRDADLAEGAFQEVLARFPSCISTRTSHAVFRMECLGDYAFAREVLTPLWEQPGTRAIVAGEWIRLLLETGREAEAVTTLTDGTLREHLWAGYTGVLMGVLLLRLDVGMDALAELHNRVKRASRGFWMPRFSVLLERARSEGHPEMEWLPKLVQVLRDEEPASILDAWPAWRAAGERA